MFADQIDVIRKILGSIISIKDILSIGRSVLKIAQK